MSFNLRIRSLPALFVSLCVLTAPTVAQSQTKTPYAVVLNAGKTIALRPTFDKLVQHSANNQKLDIASTEKLIKQNQHKLQEVRAALQRGIIFPTLKNANEAPPVADFTALRNVTRLFVIEGQLKAVQGDINGAASSFMDALDLGSQIPRNGFVFMGLLGVACEATARMALQENMARYNAATCRKILTRWQSIEKRRPRVTDIYEVERRWFLNSVNATRQQAFDLRAEYEDSEGSSELEYFKVPSRAQLEAQITTYFDTFISQVEAPKRLRVLPAIAPSSMFSLSFNVVSTSVWSFDRSRAASELLRTSIAVRAHYLESGQYPTKLSDLPTDLLPAIPIDPFGRGESIYYRPQGDGYLLWSVGPDGRNDGGKPIRNPALKGKRQYVIHRESRGDVVAGLNY